MNREALNHPITHQALTGLKERHGQHWNIWPSAQGVYACATLRRGLAWSDPSGRHPVGRDGAYVQSLITDSIAELREAIEQENDIIERLLTEGTLKAVD